MTSKPLLSMVAQSSVIFGPIFQLGWASASRAVTEESAWSGTSRRAPPLAVSKMRAYGAVRSKCRHCQTAETYLVLRGVIKVLFYVDRKRLLETFLLDPREGNYGVHIPKGQWHTLEVLESGTVIFEVKDGPYQPLVKDDILE